MSRLSIAAAAALLCFPLLRASGEATVDARSAVFFAQDDQALDKFEENPVRTRTMVDALVKAATGQPDTARAWRALVAPVDGVGIKVSTAGGRYFSSHRGVVSSIITGLEQAGIPRDRIIIWDRSTEDLRAAGYPGRFEGCAVRAVDPPRGYDREATIAAPVLGRLMWGDLLFRQKPPNPFGKEPTEIEQLSSTSHLATIVSKDITKIINVPVLSDERGCGIAGALYNVTVPNVDNWRRFTQSDGMIATSPAELYADPRIGPKVVLNILDALLAQYAGGTAFNPNYSFAHETIYASKDPVALDATGLRKLDEWRKAAKLPPLAKQGAWLQGATELGLGNSAEQAIVVQQVELPK